MGEEDVVKLLLAAGTPVSPAKFRQWPPVHAAAHAGRVEILRLLLAAGVSADALDKCGQTHLATFGHFHTPVLRSLLEAGDEVNARDNDGETALMHAASHGYERAARVLLEHHSDIHTTDNKGRTALMHAATGEYVDAIPLLLERGADLQARDRDGRTDLELAREAKNEVAVELLRAAAQRERSRLEDDLALDAHGRARVLHLKEFDPCLLEWLMEHPHEAAVEIGPMHAEAAALGMKEACR